MYRKSNETRSKNCFRLKSVLLITSGQNENRSRWILLFCIGPLEYPFISRLENLLRGPYTTPINVFPATLLRAAIVETIARERTELKRPLRSILRTKR